MKKIILFTLMLLLVVGAQAGAASPLAGADGHISLLVGGSNGLNLSGSIIKGKYQVNGEYGMYNSDASIWADVSQNITRIDSTDVSLGVGFRYSNNENTLRLSPGMAVTATTDYSDNITFTTTGKLVSNGNGADLYYGVKAAMKMSDQADLELAYTNELGLGIGVRYSI